MSLQTFLEQLRRDAERDAETMIDLATRKSRSMADDTVPNGSAPSPIVEPPARVSAPLPSTPPTVVLVAPADAQAPVVEMPPLVMPAPVAEPAPVEPDVPPVLAPVDVAPVVESPPVVDSEPVPDPAVAPPAEPPPVAAVVPTVPEAELVDDDLRTVATSAAEPKRKRRFPLSAVLEVSAIVLILVFILLRLG